MSFQAVEVQNFTLSATPALGTPAVTGLNFCNVSLVLSHIDDIVHAWVWLPLDNWNGRSIVVGGGGLSAGHELALIDPVLRGFAAGATDAGLTLNNTIDAASGEWAIRSVGVLNTELIENFAHRSIHDVATISKAAVRAYYRSDAQYTYYSGCSTGGRQGYSAARWHPDDFDGILANAPALYTPRVSPGTFWPSVVMRNIAAPPTCIFEAYYNAIISACDSDDGVLDGIISKPEECKFDTETLLGTSIPCLDTRDLITISKTYAEVVSKILEGARSISGEFLWYGVPFSAPFDGLASTSTTNGTTIPVPFSAGEAWIRYFVLRNPSYNTAEMDFSNFEAVYQSSVDTFTDVLGTDTPDMTRFQKAGGKLLTWHGLADPYITHESSLRYRRALEAKIGSPEKTNEFHRLFLAPGAGHCSGGVGPVPTDPLAALLNWVENGHAPDSLFANTTLNGNVIERNLCPYPRVQTYVTGNPNVTGSFTCM